MIIDTLNEMRIAALKSGDKQVENHASYFLSVAKKVIKDGGDEAKVIAIFQKEVKALRETLGYARNEAEKTALTSRNKEDGIQTVMNAMKGKADGKMINAVITKMMQ